MAFQPIGPDFAFIPQDGNFKRLSRRNEGGVQGMVEQVFIDPKDPATLYAIARPGPASWPTLFRTRDQGLSWTPISDVLQQSEPSLVDVSGLAVDPVATKNIYISTYSGGLYVSGDRGTTWGPRSNVGAMVRSLFIDARTAGNPNTTTIYAGTNTGVWVSTNGGGAWTQSLAGNVLQVSGFTPPTGAAHFFATVFETGLFHSNDPLFGWKNLNDGVALPKRDPMNLAFDYFAVDYCLDTQNPGKIRVYAMMNTWGSTLGIFTTNDPESPWTNQNAVSPPAPGQGSYTWGLAVAPNSPGDGATDVLFANNQHLCRSTDGGKSWTNLGVFHDDYHSARFFPRGNNPPLLFFGCDGGIGMTSKFTDPTFDAPSYHDEGDTYSDLGTTQNLSHGMQNHGAIDVWSDPAAPALRYINCQDVGVIGGAGDLGWRSIDVVDAWMMTGALGGDGVKVWYYAAVPNWLKLVTDKGAFGNSKPVVALDTASQNMVPTSNLVTGLDSQCLLGIWPRDPNPTLTADVSKGTDQVVTPSSMQFIENGTVLLVESEKVSARNVTATTFTADFANDHKMGAGITLQRLFVVRADQKGGATQVSQDFNAQLGSGVSCIGVHPTDANQLYCATGPQRLFDTHYPFSNFRVFTTNAGATANASTVWTELTGANKPNNLSITSITVDNGGNVYVMLNQRLTVTYQSQTLITPLYQITGGDWVPQLQTNLPASTPAGFGPLRADPVQANTFYTSNGARVHRLTLANGSWTWSDISDGLPGAQIMNLWVGNIGDQNNPRVMLRIGTSGRGAWERDVTANVVEPSTFPFLRANFLDLRRLARCPNGVADPYDPTNAGAKVFHYQSPDIKIDAAQLDSNNNAFFQTDPEAPFPLSHVHFTLLKDNSDNIPQLDQAWVHVQVQNRGVDDANAVQVWALYANASAGVPSLSASAMNGNKYDFWSQFWNTGQIVPSLPTDSPWKMFGKPQTLNGVSAAGPLVASWQWTVPKLANGDIGHYCVAAFIHSTTSQLVETSTDMDDVATRNPQTALKNLHIGPPLMQGGPPPPPPPRRRPNPQPWMREYVQFHNPTAHARQMNLAIDLRGLPPELSVAFRLSPLETARSLSESISGLLREDEPHCAPWSDEERHEWHAWLLVGKTFAVELVEEVREHRSREANPAGLAHAPFHLEPHVYRAAPSSLVQVHGVRLAPYHYGEMLMVVQNRGHLPPGSEYSFQVQQIVNERVVGGSVYKVRIAGVHRVAREPNHPEPKPSPFDVPLLDAWRPPWVRNLDGERRKTFPNPKIGPFDP